LTRIPDLIGYLIEDAEKILLDAGIEYHFSETSSPRNDVEGDEKRIVRQVIKDNVLYITLCRY